MSNYDANTFSKINNGDDKGYAAKFQLNNSKQLKEKNKLTLNTGLDYEYVQSKFRPLERLRSVEFSRDWGLPLLVQPATENIIRASAGLQNSKGQALTYRFTSYTRGDDYKDFRMRSIILLTGKAGNSKMSYYYELHALNTKGAFLRPTLI